MRDQNVYYARYTSDNMHPETAVFETRTQYTGTWKVTDENTITFTNADNSYKTFTIKRSEADYLEVYDHVLNSTYCMRREY